MKTSDSAVGDHSQRSRGASLLSGGPSDLSPTDGFESRHIGPDAAETREMLGTLGYDSMESFISDVVPSSIRLADELALEGIASGQAAGGVQGEHAVLEVIRGIASRNKVFRSCIGMGYHGTIVPGVIQRNILENPGWYTQYTPYQAEISQGRLEALLNFQTMVSELTGMEVASASLLDEATAAAEALTMALNIAADRPRRVFVSDKCHPQTIGVVSTRSAMMDVECVVGDPATADLEVGGGYAGVLLQYPETNGSVERVPACVTRAKASGAIVICAADLLALTLLESPGALGADIAVGSTQRFGVPMGYGGPHAAYLATGERHVRRMPGRIVGVSKDADGKPALRLALQTREQHIKRDRATSNICTAQVLLAVMAGMYAVYHGPEGLRRIARRVNGWTRVLAKAITDAGHRLYRDDFFDMICVEAGSDADRIVAAAERKRINLRSGRRTGGDEDCVGVSLDETVTRGLVEEIAQCFGGTLGDASDAELLAEADASRGDSLPLAMRRGADYMLQPVFNTMESESELLRYIFKLQSRDLSLAHSMIPLGSCTMKLNATSEMVPVSWAEFGGLHPYAPPEQAAGYHELIVQLKRWLCEITGFEACSMQPNSGAQGEYAGLLAIKRYHEARGEGRRRVCIVPESAHGTNPASAVMAGMKVVPVKNRSDGGIDYDDLRAKVEHHADELSALMVTYPSTCGVFDANIRDICALVHEHGGQVYMDGANMNAQVGLCRPGDIGADVCHLNLHKTFCIPHGGGGPGMGPIGVAGHLSDFLPGDPQHRGTAAVSAAPFGSPSILPISWMYIAMMGAAGLRRASEVAILNANYMAARLEGAYDVMFRGADGRVAHEFVIDCRPFKKSAGIQIDDIAKRLMDYGFHAPTMSWPVPGTLMIEPTESEPKPMLDAFCDAMLAIREEIRRIEAGDWDRSDNPLKHAPHTTASIAGDWQRGYSRELAVFPVERLRQEKFWPSVARVDNPYGDRNLVCSCEPLSSFVDP